VADLDRRKLIMYTALGILGSSDPVWNLVNMIVKSDSGNAYGASVKGRRFIHLEQMGAPARWMYDLFLNPYNSDKFIHNPHMNTSFKNANQYTEGEYRLIQRKGIWVPPMWATDVFLEGTKKQPMDKLLDHMIHIRGIDMGNSAHDFCQKAFELPIGAQKSISALAADVNNSFFGAINLGGTNLFKSQASKNSIEISSKENIIEMLLTPFQLDNTAKNILEKSKRLTNSRDEFTRMVYEQGAEYAALINADINAKALIESATLNFEQKWANLLSKYKLIVNNSIHGTITGINDKPIGKDTGRSLEYAQHKTSIVSHADVRNVIRPKTANIQTINDVMAARFAAIEFIATNNLCYSVKAEIPGMIFLDAPTFSQIYDEHEVGSIPSLLINSLNYLALSSCLSELIETLKTNNLFDDTLIMVNGEFNRLPKADLSGSDHSFKGASVCLYGGKISGPKIIGDITTVAPTQTETYPGTYGYGADVAYNDNSSIKAGNIASCIATFIDNDAKLVTSPSLIIEEEGELKPRPDVTTATIKNG